MTNRNPFRWFGLRISIDSNLPGVLRRSTPDPYLRVREISDHIPTTGETRSVHSDRLTWPEVGTFEIRNGEEIRYHLEPDADPVIVRNLVLGTCLGVALAQRDYLVLHGSVVDVDGEAMAFVGHQRAGKSTTAAALLARGHNLLSDDIVAIRYEDGQPVAVPGFPYFKLDPDNFDPGTLPAEPMDRPETGRGKLYYELTGEFPTDPVPLSTISLLDSEATDGSEPRCEPLTGHDAAMTLLEHAWVARVRTSEYVESWHGDDELSLDRFTRLAEHCTVQRLSIPHGHETLDGLGRAVESLLDTDD